MTGELLSGTPGLLLLIQGTACLALGLVASHLLRRRAAWAHQVLLTALLASVLMPAWYLLAGHCGLGILAPRTGASGTTLTLAEASSSANGDVPAIGSDQPQGLPALRPPATDSLLLSPPSGNSMKPDDTRAGRPRHEGGIVGAPLPAAESTQELTPTGKAGIGETPVAHVATTPVPWGRIAVGGWATATVLLLLRLVLRFGLGRRIVRTARPLEDGRLRRALEMAKERLGAAGSVQIRGSDKIRSPVIWCWSGAPVLLVQEDAGKARGPTDWVGVFCHELAHWKRRDHLSGLLAETLTAVFPWHPLLWRAKSRLLTLSEHVCDDWVLAGGQAGLDYAQALLDLAPGGQAAFVPTIVGKEKAMKKRIRRIVQNGCGDPRIGVRSVVAVSAVALLASVGVALAQRDPAPVPRERAERESPKARERPESPKRVEAQQREALERLLGQLSEQIRDKEAALRERGDRPNGDRQTLEFELQLLREMAEQLEGRLRRPDRRGPEWIFQEGRWLPRPRREAEEREVILRRERSPQAEARLNELRRHREELAENARNVERELRGLRDGQDQEARELRGHLERLHAEIGDVERQLEELSRDREAGGIDRPKSAPPEIEMRKRRAEVLREEIRRLEQRLSELPPDRDREADELRAHLERLHAEMGDAERQLAELSRDQEAAGIARTRPPQREIETVKQIRALLTEEMRRLEQRLHELPPDQDQEAREIRDKLDGIRHRIADLEVRSEGLPRAPSQDERLRAPVETRQRMAPREGRQLEAEVQELRNQIQELREQMQQMQRTLEQRAQ